MLCLDSFYLAFYEWDEKKWIISFAEEKRQRRETFHKLWMEKSQLSNAWCSRHQHFILLAMPLSVGIWLMNVGFNSAPTSHSSRLWPPNEEFLFALCLQMNLERLTKWLDAKLWIINCRIVAQWRCHFETFQSQLHLMIWSCGQLTLHSTCFACNSTGNLKHFKTFNKMDEKLSNCLRWSSVTKKILLFQILHRKISSVWFV